MDPKTLPSQVLIRTMAKKPGWKESNFQVFHFIHIVNTSHSASLSEKGRIRNWVHILSFVSYFIEWQML